MEEDKKHMGQEQDDFFEKVSIPYEKSKAEVWDQLQGKLEDFSALEPKAKAVTFPQWRMAVAAALLLFAGTAAYLWLYTEEITSPKGQHYAHTLPDGSTVNLNAESVIVYHPYRWRLNRAISFEGEALFSVQKGSTFSAVSTNGTTEVLGTSFNIYTRYNDYKVYCKTGKVKVSYTTSDTTLLVSPGELAEFNNKMTGDVINMPADKVLGWRDNKFNFTSTPLLVVMAELERQYDIEINLILHNKSDLQYTGYFSKAASPEQTISLICKSFNLNFVKDAEGHFIVRQN